MRLTFILKLVLFLCTVRQESEAILDVLVAGKEVQRFLFDLSTDLYIVKDGRVSPVIRNPHLATIIPVIEPHVKYLELKFASTKWVHYELSLRSSDNTIMKKPRTNIPYRGKVPRNLTAFKIFFPCTGEKSGEVLLFVDIQFFDKLDGKLAEVHLKLRRQCRAAKVIRAVLNPCRKSCDYNDLKRAFCISDFVVRGKVEKFREVNGKPEYVLKVTRRFKRGHIRIKRRHQAMEIRGTKLTCSCQKLTPKSVYLIFGREDRRYDSLFLDDFTIAMPWGKRVKRFLRTYRQRLNCPPRLSMYTRY